MAAIVYRIMVPYYLLYKAMKIVGVKLHKMKAYGFFYYWHYVGMVREIEWDSWNEQ